ncbi:hypothetical protein RRG08_017036 [Elysia crispata]|uniref:Uncharacterized protein n=1 Tax=Elysia crispata TaxID=231223 RepID=A0AAE0XZR2_9GAST|nr:hypothetical protein RRG08_017036 [Elysia crispata]
MANQASIDDIFFVVYARRRVAPLKAQLLCHANFSSDSLERLKTCTKARDTHSDYTNQDVDATYLCAQLVVK